MCSNFQFSNESQIRNMLVRSKIEGPIDGVDKVASVLRFWLQRRCKTDRDKEHFWSIGLDTKMVVKYVEVVTIGTLDASLVHPREVFRFAIMQGVSSLIIGHNHPSGDIQPSAEDRAVTRALSSAGKVLGIPLHDHLIIGTTGKRFSFAESLPEDLRTS